VEPEEIKIDFFLSCLTPKEAKQKMNSCKGLFVVDVHKIARDLGYDSLDLKIESQFILDLYVRKKIMQGIYNCKGEGVLVCHSDMSESFKEKFEIFLKKEIPEASYTICFI
jgi:hypothetical protein